MHSFDARFRDNDLLRHGNRTRSGNDWNGLGQFRCSERSNQFEIERNVRNQNQMAPVSGKKGERSGLGETRAKEES